MEFADGVVAEGRRPRSPTRCTTAGAGRPEHLSKIARALGPRALDAPDLVRAAEARLRVDPHRGAARRDRAVDRASPRARPRRATRRRRRGRPPGARRDPPDALRPAHVPHGARPGVGRVAPRRAQVARRPARRGARRRRAPRAARDAASSELAAIDRRRRRASARRPPRRARRRTRRAARRRCAPTRYFALLERLLAASRAVPAVGRGRTTSSSTLGDLVGEAVEEAARRRATTSATIRPTPSCTRCASAPSARATRPRRWRPRSARGRSASRRRSPACRRCSASTRTPSSPAQWLRDHAPTADDGERRVRRRAARRGSRPPPPQASREAVARRVEARPPQVAAAVDVSSHATVRAAGGIVLRRAPDGDWQVLLVHRPRYDDWSLPKGKADAGESDEETALREVEEETGLRCTLGAPAGRTRYRDSKGRDKVVHYWLMEPESDERPPTARSSPTTRSTRCTGARSPRPPSASPTPTTASSWPRRRSPRDRLPRAPRPGRVPRPLEGRRHAATALEGREGAGRRHRQACSRAKPIDLIMSSPYLRCVGTVEPLAEKLGARRRDVRRARRGRPPVAGAAAVREGAGP